MNTIDISYIANSKSHNAKSNIVFSPNEILDMTIKDKSDKTTTLSSNKFHFTVPSNEVVGNIGDKVSFEVISFTAEALELKQLGTTVENVTRSKISQKSSMEILEIFKNNNVLHETNKYIADEDELRDMKAQEVIRKIQNQLKYATNNTSDSAVRELLANGINLNKITLDILTSVMTEIDTRPIKEVTNEELTELTNSYLYKNNISTDYFEEKAALIKEIKNSGLPPTKNNIEIIENTLSKVEKIKNSDDFTKFLKENLEPTIENLYAQTFSGTQESPEINSEYEKVINLYKNLSKELNIDYNQNTETLFKNFIANDIDITVETLEKYNNLKEKLENLDKNDLIKELIETIKIGKKPVETNLLNIKQKTTNTDKEAIFTDTIDTINTLNQASKFNINFFIHNYNVLKVNDIKDVIKENKTLETISETPTTIEQKKSLLQLMQQLTHDVAYRLAKSGININTSSINTALEEIKKIQTATYSQALIQFDVANSETNQNIISTTFENISNLTPFSTSVYGQVISGKVNFNINEVSKSLESSRAIKGYEVFETEVSNKWHDSFSKVSSQILPFLENLGLDPNDKNFRSAEILIKNHMDLTLENIENIKEIDLKIDKLQERLHPRIVAKLLADGNNPLNMDIDHILNSIDEYDNFYGEDVKDKIASYLLEAEKSKDISEETLKAIKSIYKALNIIQRNNGASIGTLFNASHNLTIGNLLDSSKYFSQTKNNRSKIDTFIGDENIEIVTNPDSIKSTVEQGISQSYEKLLLEKFAQESTPEGLSIYIEQNSDYKDKIIENVIDILKDINENISKNTINDNVINDALEKIENALSNTSVSVNFLAENNIPLTMENLFHFKEMIDKPFEISKKLRKALDDDDNLKKVFKELNEEDLKSNDTQGSLIDIAVGEIENYEPKNLDLSLNKASVLGQLELYSSITKSDNNKFTQLPIKLPLSDEVTTLNMYVLNEDYENKDIQRIGFSLDTDMLGNISALATINGDSIIFNISGNNNLSENKDELKEFFKELGYTNIDIIFDNKDSKSLIINDF